MEQNAIITKHKLDFEVAPCPLRIVEGRRYLDFRVGTCTGLYTCTDTSYEILAILNMQGGNGHFDDVLQWFEHSCRRDKKSLRFVEILQPKFMHHLIRKRGFKKTGKDSVEKKFN